MVDKSNQEAEVKPAEESAPKSTVEDREAQAIQNQETKVQATEVPEVERQEARPQETKPQETKEANQEYLFLKGTFNYGGRNKTYGLISCIVDQATEELIRLDLLEQDQNFNFRLEASLRGVAEFYRNQLNNYRSKKMAEQLSVNLTRDVMTDIFAAASEDDTEAIADIFKEKLEDILQESIRIEIVKEVISHQELKRVYPELFETPEEEEEIEGEETTGLQGINESEEGSEGLDAQIELKCTPIISAIRGRRITQLEAGEKLLVNITDNRNLGQDLSDLLERHNGAAIGTIEEINYNEELDRYRVLVKFKRNIYGRLVADPEVKITTFNQSETVEPAPEENFGFQLDQEIILLFGGIGIIVVLLIIIIIVM